MATIDSVKLPDNSTYDLTDNYSGYQTETLATPITVDGTSETTVEGALGAVNDYADKIKGSMSNENFVDNPFFTVNERGFSSQSITSKTYTVSRWYGQSDSAATFSISGSGYSIASGSNDAFIMQLLNNYSRLNGKTVTASVKLSDGTIKSGTVTLNTGTSVDILTETTFKVRYASGSHGLSIVSFAGNTTVIKAVKLELGSISTLANDVAPDYAFELAKCQTSTADPSDTYANQGQLMTSALQSVLGAVNKLVYPYYSSSFTDSNITFTDNGNGTVTVSTSGAASAQKDFWLSRGTVGLISTYLENGTYKLSGCPAGGDLSTKYKLLLTYQNPSNVEVAVNDIGDGATFTINGSYGDSNGALVAARIIVRSGTTIGTPIVFKPMIHDSRISVPSHVPYAQTNKQLTDDLRHKAVTVSTEAGISLLVKSVVHNNNTLVGTLRFSGITISGDWVAIGNISAHPTDTVVIPAVNLASGSPSFIARIESNGNMAVYGANGSGLTLQFCFACETTN